MSDERWEMIWRHSFDSVRRLLGEAAPPPEDEELAPVLELPVSVEPEEPS
jgi:hypothetical protein